MHVQRGSTVLSRSSEHLSEEIHISTILVERICWVQVQLTQVLVAHNSAKNTLNDLFPLKRRSREWWLYNVTSELS
jgi:hypothetical protein